MLVSLKDRATGKFNAPILVSCEEEAIRNLTMVFMDGQKSMITQFPSNYELYSVADFDVSSGIITPINPTFIINALTAKQNAIKCIQENQVDITAERCGTPSELEEVGV